MAVGDAVAPLLHVSSLLLLAIVWYGFGRVFQRLRFPLVTGYVVGGILSGPSVSNLLRGDALRSLIGVDHACLSIIALTAGAELHLADLRRIQKQVVAITLSISAFTFVAVFAAMLLLAPVLPLTRNLTSRQIEGIASLAATLMIARSPASAIAVLKETEGKGPYCSLVMAVIVMKDVLVFMCFALNIEFARVMDMKGREGAMRMAEVLLPFLRLVASLLLGVCAGVALATFVQWRPAQWKHLGPLARTVPPGFALRLQTGMVAGVAVTTFWLAERLGAEPLLSCVIAGIITANRRAQEAGGKELLSEHTARMINFVNTVFFGIAGASMRLAALVPTVGAAAVVWGVRLCAIYCGSFCGAWLGGTPPDLRRMVWQGMVTQAGVALGLAKTVAIRFPDWGPDFATLMVAVIIMNLLAGPSLFRGAIYAMGEARSGAAAPADANSVLPHSGSSHSLAQRLRDNLSKEEKALSTAELGMGRNVSSRATIAPAIEPS